MTEPSVLDVVKEKLHFWKRPSRVGKNIVLPEDTVSTAGPSQRNRKFPYFSILTILMGLLAQSFLEKTPQSILPAVIFYVGCATSLIAAFMRNEILLGSIHKKTEGQAFSMAVRWVPLLISLLFSVAAFLAFRGNQFTWINLSLWCLAAFFFWLSLREKNTPGHLFKAVWKKISHRKLKLKLKITPFVVLMLATSLIIVYFRFHDLSGTPGEMFSDHAEKLLDVSDILEGKFSIFFPRNTGREAIQMYLTAGIAGIFHTGISFMSLKIGTALGGLLTLPYVFLLGKYLYNKWVGWLAFFLAGIAYWPNVISRVGLRFPFYPLFVAPVFYYLIRGIRESSRNKLILAGFLLGLGLHGYSPIRILPIIVVLAFGIFITHRSSKDKKISAIWTLFVLGIAALIIFLPLLRYWIEDPGGFNSRAISRITSIEAPFNETPFLVFLKNFWKASVMFFYKNGQIWVHSIPGRPALDLVSASFFFIGVIVVLTRYLRQKNWEDIFLLLSVPLLLMPSILSIAFPDENPSLNRTGGAIIPVFIIAAVGFYALFSALHKSLSGGVWKGAVASCAVLFLLMSAGSNYKLVFEQYREGFLAGAWNTSDIGTVIRNFSELTGSPDNAFVVPYPHWVDTRLVGINAGFPQKDYALWPEDFPSTIALDGKKIFILKGDDQEDLDLLRTYYPEGILYRHRDEYQGKDFVYWLVVSE